MMTMNEAKTYDVFIGGPLNKVKIPPPFLIDVPHEGIVVHDQNGMIMVYVRRYWWQAPGRGFFYYSWVREHPEEIIDIILKGLPEWRSIEKP